VTRPAELVERIKGCLVGGAIGDCLGAPHEGTAGAKDAAPPYTWRTTDDTQLTLATARAIVDRGRVDPAAIAAALTEAFVAGGVTGLGASTFKALTELAAGGHWALTGRRGEMAAGNGAAMRIAPLAFHLDLGSQLHRRLLRDVCRITHHSDEAYAGAVAVAAAVALSAAEASPTGLLVDVAARLPDSRTRDRIVELAELEPETPLAEVGSRFGCSGYVVESVPLALHAARQLLEGGGAFGEVLAALIAVGGDTDTNASMTGQIVGAHLGLAGLPGELVAQVPGLEVILKLAGRLAVGAR